MNYPRPLVGDARWPNWPATSPRRCPRTPQEMHRRGGPEGRRLHLRRVLFPGRAGPQQTGPHRAVAADGPPVPQRRGRPDRQLPHGRPLGRATRAARRVFQIAAIPQQRSRSGSHRSARCSFDFGDGRPRPRQVRRRTTSRSAGTGSVLAPETGEYEFIVRTEHAARLWVNDSETPLIDAWVKSGNDTEYRGSIFLLGGRAYPLRLEFSKAKQGVDDSKEQEEQAAAGQGVHRAGVEAAAPHAPR